MKLWAKVVVAFLSLTVIILGSMVYFMATDVSSASVSIIMADGTVVPEMRIVRNTLQYMDEGGEWKTVAHLEELYDAYVLTEAGVQPTDPPVTPSPAPALSAPVSPSPSAVPTVTPEPSPTATETVKPTATATPKATSTPKPTAKATATPKPTATVKPTATPTPRPEATQPPVIYTPKPTAAPTPKPPTTTTPPTPAPPTPAPPTPAPPTPTGGDGEDIPVPTPWSSEHL